MTREEAIHRLKNTAWLGTNKDREETEQAVDMAIEALTNEWTPITVSEPNTSDHVLVTYKWCDDDYETSELDYWVTKHEAENGNEKCKRLIDHVIAWRRMPGPYKEGE